MYTDDKLPLLCQVEVAFAAAAMLRAQPQPADSVGGVFYVELQGVFALHAPSKFSLEDFVWEGVSNLQSQHLGSVWPEKHLPGASKLA